MWMGDGPRKNSKIAIAFISILILVAGYFTFKERAALKIRWNEIDQSLSKLVNQHNAITNWAEFGERDKVYVLDLQNALVRQDRRPVLLNVNLIDILNKDNQYLIHFKPSSVDVPKILFVLECDSEQVKKVIHTRDEELEYAVVALISSVSRQEKGNDSEEEHFLANGHCLDLLPLDY